MQAKLRWPNLFVVGAPRAGTTSLYNYLKHISGIYMCPVKEPKYFMKVKSGPSFTEDEYLELFSRGQDKPFLGEASADYLQSLETPERIKKTVPDAKIIISLRDPAERTFSHYLNRIRTGDATLPFDTAVEEFFSNPDHITSERNIEGLISTSMYYNAVSRYYSIFPKENVKIIFFEDLVNRPDNTINSVIQFLGLNSPLPPNLGKKYNSYSKPIGQLGRMLVNSRAMKTITRRIVPDSTRKWVVVSILARNAPKPTMSEKSRKMLYNFFRNDAVKIQQYLNQTPPWPTQYFSKESEKHNWQ